MWRRIIDTLFVLGLLGIISAGVVYFKFVKTKEQLLLPKTGKLNVEAYHAQLQKFAKADKLLFKDFAPRPALVTDQHEIQRAKFPVFDAHIHLRNSELSPEEVVRIMEACNIRKVVNLDTNGLWEERLRDQIKLYQEKYPDRFITATNINLKEIDDPDFSFRTVAQLDESYKLGARAIKIWRNLGLRIRDRNNKLIHLDDPRLHPIWRRAGELRIPVIMHNADPTALWMPVDRHNERYQELQARLTEGKIKWGLYGPFFHALTGTYYKLYLMRHPEQLYYHSEFEWSGDYFPFKEELLAQRDSVIARHPQTLFIGAHMGYSPDDLNFLGKELDTYPNFFVEMSHVVPELGRQPYTAREFFIKYQDRIIFGLDGKPEIEAYRSAFRFLETKDEYFDYPRADWKKFGYWKIYGIYLPDEVLEKIYYRNAEAIFSYETR